VLGLAPRSAGPRSTVISHAVLTMDEPKPREVQLRPEYAAEYPGIEAGVWQSAAELAQRLVEHTHARRRLGLYTRTFDPRHFEFRGGVSGLRPATARTRSSDQREART
jgi:hypothetical protein